MFFIGPTSFSKVIGSILPVCGIPALFWKLVTAFSVAAPKSPSILIL